MGDEKYHSTRNGCKKEMLLGGCNGAQTLRRGREVLHQKKG